MQFTMEMQSLETRSEWQNQSNAQWVFTAAYKQPTQMIWTAT